MFSTKLNKIKSIEVHCRGGLGNQIFQVCAGQYFAEKFQAKLLINLESIAQHDDEKPVDISFIPIFSDYSIRRNNKLVYFKNRLICKKNIFLPSVRFSEDDDISLGKYDRIFRFMNTIHLYGYFADFSFAIESKIFDATFDLFAPSEWFLKMKKIITNENIVALHVRRGDFTSNPEQYGLLDNNYYNSALKEVVKRLPRAKIWVFSDDLTMARDTLDQIADVRLEYLEPSLDSNALETLILISLAKGQILANSTFSFWAAFLSKSSKIVCYPAKNIHGEEIVKKIPKEWVAVNESWI